ncbi:MAG: Gfo/Idh/MocA family protein [Chitinophagaceae bacterium]
MQIIQFAIIGCGRIAQRHALHIANFGKLAAVCDIDIDKATQLGNQYQATFYTQITDLLSTEKQVDIIVICTPNGLHASQSIQALKAGFHVLVEKPMAITTADGEQMIAEAIKAKKYLFPVKQNRYNPPVVAVKEALDNGYLGKIYSLHLNCFWNRGASYYANSWKGTKALDGGTLFTQFSHFIDLLYWLNGDVASVKALAGNFVHKNIIEFEDTGAVLLQFTNGSIGSIHYTVNSYQKNMEGSLTIFAEKGTVKIGGQYLNELDYQCIEGYEIKNLAKGNPPNQYGNYVGSMSNHDKVYENVVAVLQNNQALATTAFDALQTVTIIEKIYSAINK